MWVPRIDYSPVKLMQVDDWRDIALPKDCTKPTRVRTLGSSSAVTGFGNEYGASGHDSLSHNGYFLA